MWIEKNFTRTSNRIFECYISCTIRLGDMDTDI